MILRLKGEPPKGSSVLFSLALCEITKNTNVGQPRKVFSLLTESKKARPTHHVVIGNVRGICAVSKSPFYDLDHLIVTPKDGDVGHVILDGREVSVSYDERQSVWVGAMFQESSQERRLCPQGMKSSVSIFSPNFPNGALAV